MDEDKVFMDGEEGGQETEESFAALLEESLKKRAVRLTPGQKVSAKILQFNNEWAFLDTGQKGEGILDIHELQNEEGEMTVAVGDTVQVYFLSASGGEMRFTSKLGGAAGALQMEEAWRSGIPVEGKIEKEIKGGYEVRLPGNVRAFCPFSQLGIRRQVTPEEVLGQSFSFKITQFGERGRNVVVSHRVLAEEEQRRKREELKETLAVGQTVKGVVTNIRDFGAFVDIGGIEGLVPISEITYGRVEDINSILQIGQEVEVAIKNCDWEKNRFSFSIRDTLADPWSMVDLNFREGGRYAGKVVRLTPFGAFVALGEGIDGLIHVSKLSRLGNGKPVKHPQDVLEVGQEVLVSIEKIDRDQRRIALVPIGGDAQVNEEAQEVEEALPASYVEKPSGSSMGTFADLLKNSGKKKRR